jgi:hypothetical protein
MAATFAPAAARAGSAGSARAAAPARPDRLAWLLLLTPLLATTFLAKWGVPIGPRDLAMSWPIILGALALGWITGRLTLDPVRFGVFLALIGALGAIQVLRGDPFSLPSLLFMAAIFGCYVVSLERAPPSGTDALRLFATVCTVIAIAAIAQFGLQFVVGRTLAFPVDNLVPKAMLIEGYNNQIPIDYGATIQKANGVFLLEPSFLSQLMAVALIAELAARTAWGMTRLMRLALFAAALMLSYSGTGLIILGIVLPVLIIAQRRWMLLVAALAGLALASAFHEPLQLGIYLERADEFSSIRSSGFERFVSPFYLFEEFLWRDPWRSLFGFGPGSYIPHASRAYYPAAEIAFSKIVFEFGIVGAAAVFGFLVWVVFRSPAPVVLKCAVLVMFFMSGLYTAASHGIALTLLAWPPDDAPTGARS